MCFPAECDDQSVRTCEHFQSFRHLKREWKVRTMCIKCNPTTHLSQKHRTIHTARRGGWISSSSVCPIQRVASQAQTMNGVVFLLVCFYASVVFFFLSSSLHSRLKATRRPWLQRWSALVVSGLQMFGFLRGAAGDHATGHGAWTPKQLFPIVLESGADLYSSHSATTGYRTSVTAPDTPTVRKSSPAGSEAIVARRQTHARHKTVDWCFKKKEKKKEENPLHFILYFFPPRVVCMLMLVRKHMCVARQPWWCAQGVFSTLTGREGVGVWVQGFEMNGTYAEEDLIIVTNVSLVFDREHSSINVKESCATKSKVPQ